MGMELRLLRDGAERRGYIPMGVRVYSDCPDWFLLEG